MTSPNGYTRAVNKTKGIRAAMEVVWGVIETAEVKKRVIERNPPVNNVKARVNLFWLLRLRVTAVAVAK